jgi:hypothetical protein
MNLSAHQRLAIKARLPEVKQVWVRNEISIIRLGYIWLDLADGSRIVIYRAGGTDADNGSVNRCRRSRSFGDYSDQIEELPICEDMQARLVAVFGPLRFSSEDSQSAGMAE